MPSRTIALRMVSNLRATAIMATFLGLPAAMRRSKGLKHGVVPPGHHSAHEQGLAHARPATADEAFAAPLARLTREGGKPDKRRDLLAAEGPKLRQLGNQRA